MANSRLCSIPDCGKPYYSRDCCRRHYYRLRVHGSPTKGRSYKGEAEVFLRNTAFNYQGEECLHWPFERNQKGRPRIWLDGKTKFANRLVCEHFNGPPPTPIHQAAHSCGHGHLGCVAGRHLRWATPKENSFDKVEHGTLPVKLTEVEVREIRALKGRMSQRDIAEKFGVTRCPIRDIHSGKSWSWVR